MENIVETKSFDFAVRIVNLYEYLTDIKKEYVLSKQLLRSGTSIGANVAEAEQAQSRPYFVSNRMEFKELIIENGKLKVSN